MDTEPSEKLQCIIEAALLASNQPLSLAQIGALFDEPTPPTSSEIAAALAQLREACEGRGVELVEVASGYRYQVRSDYHPWVNRLWAERQARYSRALLETLALIAYRQPVTRGEIEQVRGVAVSTSIVRTLEEREWIRVVGYRDVPGKPALYGTTKAFLDYFKLKSLDEMPTLAEVRDLDNFDPELEFKNGDQSIPAQIEADSTDDAPSATAADKSNDDDAGNDVTQDDPLTDDDPAETVDHADEEERA
ncbi:MAG: SMC-Scp complex subunit ScpB [Rhodanobacteraceae bacterium]